MKKVLLGLLALSAASYAAAGDFYFTNEVKMNDETNYRTDERVKTEWTVAKGYYGISDTLKFRFDADRDYISYLNDPNEQGWDTHWYLEKDLGSVEIFGRKFTNTGYLDYMWDDTDTKQEDRLGLRFKTSTKLSNGATFSTTIWGRYADRNGTSDPDSITSIGESDIWGLQFDYFQRFNKEWTLSAGYDIYYGGYHGDLGTTYKLKTNGEYRDGVNLEANLNLTNVQPIYKSENLEIDIKTSALVDMFGMGDDYDGTTSEYSTFVVRTGLAGEYQVNDTISIHAEARYNIFGFRRYGADSSINPEGKKNEFEAIAGFKIRL